MSATESQSGAVSASLPTQEEVRRDRVPAAITRHVTDYPEDTWHPLPSACCGHPIRRRGNEWVCPDGCRCTMAGCCANIGGSNGRLSASPPSGSQ